jgi:vacuolar-type H+-ATPase subunit E/Vma4
MTQAALIEALRRKGERDAEAIWEESRARAQARKADAARAIEQRCSEIAQETAAIAKELERAATAEAQHTARRIRLTASTALAGRLLGLALTSLPKFRDEQYEQRFAALAGELPSRPWQWVRVNPADQRLAETHFPPAQVACDEAIVGGAEVEAEDGRIRISNTLETRLRTAWPDILPGLIHHIFEEALNHRPAA